MDTKMYNSEDLLALSGIQHFAFCERQWALIHIEKQWVENLKTVEGNQLHERVDDPYFTETRKDRKIVRSVPLVSYKLGLSGVADVVEYSLVLKDEQPSAITIVEYKRGKPKLDDCDEVQLCAQAICLEEMSGVILEHGYFYYGETKHRHKVAFGEELRDRVVQLAKNMHRLYQLGSTPVALKGKKCRNCSLLEVCLPVLGKKAGKAKNYLTELVKQMEAEIAGD